MSGLAEFIFVPATLPRALREPARENLDVYQHRFTDGSPNPGMVLQIDDGPNPRENAR